VGGGMTNPNFTVYSSEEEYRRHYKRVYCMGRIITPDGIRVYFSADRFNHAFYKASRNPGPKDTFDPTRAQRIDWIQGTLTSSAAIFYQGWNSTAEVYEPYRRVSVLHGDFIVVIEFYLNRHDELCAKFITCYDADRSINKIKTAPTWTLDKCLKSLAKI
jgi:hypothetical protein